MGYKFDHHVSYETPEWLYQALDAEFAFDLDPCPLDPLWSPERVAAGECVDGLAMDWDGHRVFCNPPYSDINPWIEKALASNALTVLLLPERCDTSWFAQILNSLDIKVPNRTLRLRRAGVGGHEIRFFRKRLKFRKHTAAGPETSWEDAKPMLEGSIVIVIRNK